MATIRTLDTYKVHSPRFENVLEEIQQLSRRVSQILMPATVQSLNQGDLTTDTLFPFPDMALGLGKSILMRRVHAVLPACGGLGSPVIFFTAASAAAKTLIIEAASALETGGNGRV